MANLRHLTQMEAVPFLRALYQDSCVMRCHDGDTIKYMNEDR